MSGMRQKLRFTAVLVVLLIILGTASYREQGKRQKLSFPESLDLVVMAVDGEQVTLREMTFYIAYAVSYTHLDVYKRQTWCR